jgi:hypothetical protein
MKQKSGDAGTVCTEQNKSIYCYNVNIHSPATGMVACGVNMTFLVKSIHTTLRFITKQLFLAFHFLHQSIQYDA